ncbi:MAG: SET domain-containing protein [Opitutaceae bacterium]
MPKKTLVLPFNGARHWRRGRSSIHASGLFAARDIPKGARVIEYVGPKLTKAEGWKRATEWLEKATGTNKGAVYVFELNSKYDIDGNVPWNIARLINHSCNPNCEPRVLRGHIWIVARKNIAEGEELAYDYGYDFEQWQDHPCRCGTDNCIGYIIATEHRPKLRRLLAAKKKKASAKKPRGAAAGR